MLKIITAWPVGPVLMAHFGHYYLLTWIKKKKIQFFFHGVYSIRFIISFILLFVRIFKIIIN